MTTLLHINVESGVSHRTGRGFCPVQAVGENGILLEGQISPEEVRIMALGWLSAAEAADSDATVFALLSEIADQQTAAAALADLRSRRRHVARLEFDDGSTMHLDGEQETES